MPIADCGNSICWIADKIRPFIMSMLRVNLGLRSYDLAIVSDELTNIGSFARERAVQGRLAYVVSDTNVIRHAATVETALAAAGFATARGTIPAGEPSKTLTLAEGLYEHLAA